MSSSTRATSGTVARRRGWWARVTESIESRLWPVPFTIVVLAVLLGIVMPQLDIAVDESLPNTVDSLVFNGGAETARTVLSSIAGSLITVTSLTFSLTVVALQLASSQASPRVLRLFARDRQVHWTLAAFLGTFAYSLTVLRSVRSDTEQIPEFVPRIAVTLAFVLTLVSVCTLVFFLAHLAAQLRVETMLKDIHAETDRTIDRVSARNRAASAAREPGIRPDEMHVTKSTSSGFITSHDHARLVEIASEHGLVIEERARVGANIVAGMPLSAWWDVEPQPNRGSERRAGERQAEIDEAIRAAYGVGYERTAAEDIDYGVQQILDIGLRALSPGVNDPTTAVHALGHLSAITTRIVDMPAFPRVLTGDDGSPRVVTIAPGAAEQVDAALSPMRHYGAEHPAVAARFVQAVDEIATLSTDAAVRAALTRQLDALAAQIGPGSGSDPASTERGLSAIAAVRARHGL